MIIRHSGLRAGIYYLIIAKFSASMDRWIPARGPEWRGDLTSFSCLAGKLNVGFMPATRNNNVITFNQ